MLLFFVVTATFSDQTLFPVDLPTAAKAETRDTTNSQVVCISKNGNFALGNDYVSDDQLMATLREHLAGQAKKTLVIQGDKGCPYEKVVMAVDCAHALGIDELCLAVKKE
jgi:biopolymer transport protein ExbD